VVAVGFVDTTEQKLSVCEFPDDQHFSNLEALVVQLSPKEVLLPITPEASLDMAEVKKVSDMFCDAAGMAVWTEKVCFLQTPWKRITWKTETEFGRQQ
jgi:DNA mismatch repair ATPase MutS